MTSQRRQVDPISTSAEERVTTPENAAVQSQNFRIGAIRAGDIIFIYDRSPGWWDRLLTFSIVHGQRILAAMRKAERLSLRLKAGRYSHVMLGMDGGTVIHADGKTVSIEVVAAALGVGKSDAALFRVYRRSDLQQERSAEVVKAAVRYHYQRYRFGSYFSGVSGAEKEDTTQFCSRLIAHAYRAANMPLSALPDNRVLPIDLHRICQASPWQDVSAEFLEDAPTKGMDEAVGLIKVTGVGDMSLTDFLRATDEIMLKGADFQKQWMEARFPSVREVLKAEAQLAQLVNLEFSVAKQSRLNPGLVDDKEAARIVRVLEQLPELLDLVELPSLKLIVAPLRFEPGDEMDMGKGVYAGLPPAKKIQEMREQREAVRMFTYLLLAELGVYSALAHRTGAENLRSFVGVKREYADRFFEAIPRVDDRDARLALIPGGFMWVEGETDRSFCRKSAAQILSVLEVVAILRGEGAGAASKAEEPS